MGEGEGRDGRRGGGGGRKEIRENPDGEEKKRENNEFYKFIDGESVSGKSGVGKHFVLFFFEGKRKTNDESNSYILNKVGRGDLQEFLGTLLRLSHPLHIGHQLSDLLLQAVVSLHQCLRFSGGEQLEKEESRLFLK